MSEMEARAEMYDTLGQSLISDSGVTISSGSDGPIRPRLAEVLAFASVSHLPE